MNSTVMTFLLIVGSIFIPFLQNGPLPTSAHGEAQLLTNTRGYELGWDLNGDWQWNEDTLRVDVPVGKNYIEDFIANDTIVFLSADQTQQTTFHLEFIGYGLTESDIALLQRNEGIFVVQGSSQVTPMTYTLLWYQEY